MSLSVAVELEQQQKLVASDAAADDMFGSSVAISGETVVVGAPFDVGAAGSIKARPMSLPLLRPHLTPRRRSRSKLQSRSGRPITNTRPCP